MKLIKFKYQKMAFIRCMKELYVDSNFEYTRNITNALAVSFENNSLKTDKDNWVGFDEKGKAKYFNEPQLIYLKNGHLCSKMGVFSYFSSYLRCVPLDSEEGKNVIKYPPLISLENDREIFYLGYFGLTCFDCEFDLQPFSEILHSNPQTRLNDIFKYPEFTKLLSDKKLKRFLETVFPDGFHCTDFSTNTIRKGDKSFYWHVDYPYHDIQPPYPENVLSVQVIWTVDDFTEENGASYFIQFSHRTRQPPYSVDAEVTRGVEKRGKVIFFIGNLWHSAGENFTDTPRSAILANFSIKQIPAKNNLIERYVDNPYCKIVDGQILLK